MVPYLDHEVFAASDDCGPILCWAARWLSQLKRLLQITLDRLQNTVQLGEMRTSTDTFSPPKLVGPMSLVHHHSQLPSVIMLCLTKTVTT